ncbi:hypothetical protein PT2222_350046 [Paraburkholderia tropica]
MTISIDTDAELIGAKKSVQPRWPHARHRRLRGGDHVDAQRFAARCDFKQTVDVRVRARTVACVGGVLGEHCEAVLGRLGVERAEGLLQIVIDRERALFARLVFDRRDHGALAVHEIDALDAVDGGQLREIVLEDVAGLNHESTPLSQIKRGDGVVGRILADPPRPFQAGPQPRAPSRCGAREKTA